MLPAHNRIARLPATAFLAIVAFVLCTIAVLPLCRARAATAWQIITWGPNAPQWDQKLTVNAMRLGCSSVPSMCMQEAQRAGRDGRKIFLSVVLDASHAAYGEQYGELSRQYPSVVEIAVDDFANVYQKLYKAQGNSAPSITNSLIDGVKSHNSHLGFGATIYEDDLHSPYLSDAKLPPSIRNKFDYIHFYIHFRADTPQTTSYLPELKRVFPNAKVILGIYAYDRISYLPCREHGWSSCSADDETNYLSKGIDADIALLKAGEATGIEFYPGFFGMESQWKGWDYPRVCPGRKQECIENTQKLRQMVAAKFAAASL